MRERVETFLRSLEPEAMDWLRRLVDVNSFTSNRPGVLEVGELCEEMFRPLGFTVRRFRAVVPENGDHLFLTRDGAGELELLLVAHLDTVFPPEQERFDDFGWVEDGGKIFGPGVCDIKGGIVLMWMALRALQAEAPALFSRITFKVLLNANEEGGCEDFPRLARAEVTPATAACLVYEPGYHAGNGTSTFVVQRKGAARFVLEAVGREAHSGNAHDQGANAIRELARAVERVESMTDYDTGLTFNVGLIRGGTVVNSVPGRAHCLVDVRAWTGEHFEVGRRRLMDLVGPGGVTSHDGASRCYLDVTELPGYPPWPANPRTERLRDAVLRRATALGIDLVCPPRQGGSDGCHLWDVVPTVDGLGPVGANAHCSTRDPATGREPESVDRASFVPRALLSVELIRELAGA